MARILPLCETMGLRRPRSGSRRKSAPKEARPGKARAGAKAGSGRPWRRPLPRPGPEGDNPARFARLTARRALSARFGSHGPFGQSLQMTPNGPWRYDPAGTAPAPNTHPDNRRRHPVKRNARACGRCSLRSPLGPSACTNVLAACRPGFLISLPPLSLARSRPIQRRRDWRRLPQDASRAL
jgi:hypothetical protein